MVASFLYPRTISVRRQNVVPSGVFGTAGYGGASPVTEAVILQNVSAGIQLDRLGRENPDRLPATTKLGYYRVLIPAAFAALGTINKNDIVVDDLGVRYIVEEPYWTPLGYQMLVQIVVS